MTYHLLIALDVLRPFPELAGLPRQARLPFLAEAFSLISAKIWRRTFKALIYAVMWTAACGMACCQMRLLRFVSAWGATANLIAECLILALSAAGVVGVIGILELLVVWSRARRALWQIVPNLCSLCGYDVRSTSNSLCPECGTSVGELQAAAPGPNDP